MRDQFGLTQSERRIARLRERDGDACYICTFPMIFREPGAEDDREVASVYASVDHLIEKARGGIATPENLRLAHRFCNNRRNLAAHGLSQNTLLSRKFATSVIAPLLVIGIIEVDAVKNHVGARRAIPHLLVE